MPRFDGSLARTLDFGDTTTTTTPVPGKVTGPRTALRLAHGVRPLSGPDKYRILDRRRRAAQLQARRLLEV